MVCAAPDAVTGVRAHVAPNAVAEVRAHVAPDAVAGFRARIGAQSSRSGRRCSICSHRPSK